MADPDVAEWLPGAMSGDARALDELARAYRPSVYRYCRSRLRDRETAEDVTQEVMLAMVQALPRHRADDHALGAFVFGIASRQVATSFRRQARVAEDPSDRLPDGVDATSDPEAVAVAHEELERVMRLVQHLPAAQQEIVMLRIAAGLSVAETAQVVGSTPGAVRVAQHRALARLRELAVTEWVR